MKHTILLIPLCVCITLIGMQRPQSTDDQFLDAIRQGNYNQVVTLLDANPILQQKIREFYNYANEPILKFPEKYPAKTDQYMKIARYLVNKGARVADSARTKLQTFEASHKEPAPMYAQPQPVYQQPAPAPTPAPKPVTMPTYTHPTPAAPAPAKPVAHSTSFFDIQKAVVSKDLRRVEESLARLDVRTLSNIEQETLFRYAVGNFVSVITYEQLVSLKKIINALLAKGVKPGQASVDVQKALKNTVGSRSAWIETPLTQAIMDGNTQEARRLITIEKVDVNEPNTLQITPLRQAIAKNNGAIAKLLLENGAQKTGLTQTEQTQLNKIVTP